MAVAWTRLTQLHETWRPGPRKRLGVEHWWGQLKQPKPRVAGPRYPGPKADNPRTEPDHTLRKDAGGALLDCHVDAVRYSPMQARPHCVIAEIGFPKFATQPSGNGILDLGMWISRQAGHSWRVDLGSKR